MIAKTRDALPRLSTIAARSLLPLASLVVACLAVEVLTRVAFPKWAPGTQRLTEFWRYDPQLGWSHIPGASGTFASFGFDVDVEINAEGFRGPTGVRPSPGRPTVSVFGDSYVWGYGVEYEEMFTTLMRTQCDANVVNYGVSGYSTDQELLLYQKVRSQTTGSIVVLVVADNDFDGNTQDVAYVYYHKPLFAFSNGQLVLQNQPVPRASMLVRATAAIAGRSFFLTQLGRAIQALMQSLQNRGTALASSTTNEGDMGDEVTRALIREFSWQVRESGSRLLVAFAGPRGARLSRTLHLRSDDTIVLLNQLIRQPRLRLEGDVHWNAEGHATVAGALMSALKRNGVNCEAAH